MKFMGAIVAAAALFMSVPARGQQQSLSVHPLAIEGYAKVSLNTTFQLGLNEDEAGLISTAEVNAGAGISAAAGLGILPQLDAELELAVYNGTIDQRTVAGVSEPLLPEEKVRLIAAFPNLFYRFHPVTNARFKLGGGVGIADYRLTDGSGLNHRGTGLIYQVKGVAEYDFGSRTTFQAEAGYLGTADFDVDLVGSTQVRESSLRGATFGLGAKVTF